MTTVLHSPEPLRSAPRGRTRRADARLLLLGLGRVGSAVADILDRERPAALAGARIAAALVRRARHAPHPFPVCTDIDSSWNESPDVVIETLGGLEPARTLVLEALSRGIPVVTANKTLLAVHGSELLDAASRFDTPLRYEAAVMAGVPFLGTFAKRPLASRVDAITGILNGTSNYVLSRVEEGLAAADALSDARQRGFAEPDASKDLDGSDAAEKLAILIRCFAKLSVRPEQIWTVPIDGIGPSALARARDLGGRLKPVAVARWSDDNVSCFVGPGFLPARDPLASLGGVLNGIRIERRGTAPLHFTGPGAGPEVTARTILDDVVEVLRDDGTREIGGVVPGHVHAPAALGWFVTFQALSLPDVTDVADLLGAHGIWVRRWGAPRVEEGGTAQSVLTFPCNWHALDSALQAVGAASGSTTHACPIVEADHV